MSRKTSIIILGVAVLTGLLYLIFGAETEKTEADQAAVLQHVTTSEITILDFESKKSLFGKWVINGHLTNASSDDIDYIEFAVKFTDNTEFVTFNDDVSAGETEVPFELKITGHKRTGIGEFKNSGSS